MLAFQVKQWTSRINFSQFETNDKTDDNKTNDKTEIFKLLISLCAKYCLSRAALGAQEIDFMYGLD